MLNEKEWYDSLFSFTGLKQSVFWQWIFTLNSIFCSRSKLVASFCLLSNSSVIRQKGESRKGCFRKTKHIKFSKKRTRTCEYQGLRNICFWKIWRTLFSWNTRFEIRPFFLLPKNWLLPSHKNILETSYRMQVKFSMKSLQVSFCQCSVVFVRIWILGWRAWTYLNFLKLFLAFLQSKV